MAARPERLIAVAVSSDGIAAVCLVGGKLKNWQLWRPAPGRETELRSKVRTLVAEFGPDIIATEDPHLDCRKRGRSYASLLALVQDAQDQPARHIPLQRIQLYRNQIEEAQALVGRFTEMAAYRPNRAIPANTLRRYLLYFEALSYAVRVCNAKRL
ncbi:MAG: hypothetical protein TEF_12600 [Rhizobiales bacterium NRL2]|nr:MAG: hypothetical protein TEF_12600 [Rhizobiales bacterium NRL2]